MTRPALPPRTSISELGLPDTPEDWLAQLEDLTLLHIAGEDASRLRIVSALLHGNEPSSLRAVHRFLTTSQRPPATDLWLLVGAVSAALGPPLFGHRFLPEHGDLNRAWLPPHEGPWAARIAELLELFRASGAEALLDVHNNTGHNPPYGVGPDDGPLPRQLTSLFGNLFVHTPIRLGTLMEAVACDVPCVAVECGRAGDPAADAVAARGLEQFLCARDLAAFAGREAQVQVLGDPLRVLVQPGIELAFGTQPVPGADLTLDPRIDRHNFQMLRPGERLGWCPRQEPPLRALGAAGHDRAAELFQWETGELRVVEPFMPVMMTTSARAALLDCLFYAVHPRDESSRRT